MDATALALLGAMFLALAAVGGASLSASSAGTLQGIVQSLGFGRATEIETDQQRQAAAIADLKRVVHAVSADVGAIGTRLTHTDHQGIAVNDRLALVDAEIAAVVAEVRSLRAARNEPAATPWRAPLDQLDAALIDTRSELGDLRTSLVEHDQNYRKDIGAITGRLDRLEHMMTRDLTASIRPVVRKKSMRRKARAIRPAQPHGESPVVSHAAVAPIVSFDMQLPRNGPAAAIPY
jgi:hypothetical protein